MEIIVSDLAKLYGISNQTLHYYEDKNILHPKRNVINNYRYYESSDLKLLGTIKKYRNAEFSLQDTVSFCGNCNEQDIISQYHKQKKFLYDEIEKKQQIIKQLDDDLLLYTRYKENGTAFFTEELEGFLRFESPAKEIIFQNQDMRTEAIPWFKNILHTRASQMFYIDENTKKITEYTYGMLASVSTAKFLNLIVTENVKEIKGGSFVTSITNTSSDKTLEELLYDCIKFINDNNYKMRGKPFTKTVFAFSNKNKEHVLLKQILIPVYI